MIAESRRQFHCLSILVVENDEDTLQCLNHYLQAMGHMVTTAPSTTQALATPSLMLCDVLISDLQFPDGDGWEMLRTIRLSRPIYAIAISNLGMTAERERSKTSGFHHHLVKPFPLDYLAAALEDAAREVITVAAAGA